MRHLLHYSDGHGGRPERTDAEQDFVISTWTLKYPEAATAIGIGAPDPLAPTERDAPIVTESELRLLDGNR